MSREPSKIKLKYPINHGGEEFTELTVSRPKAKHFRVLPAAPGFGDILNLAAKVCNVPPSVIDELDPEDLMPLMDLVGGFLPTSLGTGSKSSEP